MKYEGNVVKLADFAALENVDRSLERRQKGGWGIKVRHRKTRDLKMTKSLGTWWHGILVFFRYQCVFFVSLLCRLVSSFSTERRMADVEDRATADNLEPGTSLILRVENLRKALRELRNALRDERLSLHREIGMTILQKFVELPRNNRSSTGYLDLSVLMPRPHLANGGAV